MLTKPELVPSDKRWTRFTDICPKSHSSPSQIWSWHYLGPGMYWSCPLCFQVNLPPPAPISTLPLAPPNALNLLSGLLQESRRFLSSSSSQQPWIWNLYF